VLSNDNKKGPEFEDFVKAFVFVATNCSSENMYWGWGTNREIENPLIEEGEMCVCVCVCMRERNVDTAVRIIECYT